MAPTVERRKLNLDRLVLDEGAHPAARLDNGVVDKGAACLLEAASWLAGEPWSDHPECVSPVLGAYGRNLNDCLPQERRQELVAYVPRLLDTAGDGKDEARSLLALDWLIRVYTPAWLRLVPALVSDADALAGMRPIVDLESAAAVGDAVRQAASNAAAARAAAGAAAWAAAWDAARAADRAAAGDALQPTVDELQTSAIGLFDRLINPALSEQAS